MPEYFNAAHFLVDRHVEDGAGARTAVITPDRVLDYAGLAAEVHRVAAGLRGIGVRPEERVLLCMADGAPLLTGILGAMYLGAVPVPVSTMVTGGELAAMLTDSRARVVCGSAAFAPAIDAALDAAPEVTDLVMDGTPAGGVRPRPAVTVTTWTRLTGHPEPAARPYPTWPDSPALWLYTSGTTGAPKAAMHRHGSIRAVTETYGAQVLGIRPDDRCLSVPKLFFAYGIGNSMFFPLAVGAAAVLEPARPTPQLVAQRAAADRPTLFFAVPTFYAALLASDVPDDAFTSVRLAVSAGEPLPPALLQRFTSRFGVEVIDGLGTTEALHIFLSNRPGAVRPGATGTAVPGYRVELRDEHGVPVEVTGRPGHLFVSGPSIATGYWCRYDATRRAFQGEWLRTGDTYLRNQDGTLSCLGRSDDMLKAGGIWVSPAEVEARLLEHPDVAEAAVVAAPDADGIDKPVACVVPQPQHDLDPDALIEFCRAGLASYKRPRAIIGLPELPKTATGKIRRNVLREAVRDQLRPQRS
jgi:benzoate-CoA ligase